MYTYMKGQLTNVTEEHAVLEIQGIGYRLHLAPNYYLRLPLAPASITLYVSFVIREFSQTLYGFLEEGERDLFEKLIDISGIGPKLGLSIIGHMSTDELQDALITKDVQLLCKVPGIGKKTAERLLLELKGKSLELIRTQPQATLSAKNPPLLQDAVSALINLGYSQANAQRAVTITLESFKEPPELAMLITASLRHL